MADISFSFDLFTAVPAGTFEDGYLLSKNIQDCLGSARARDMAQRKVLIFDILELDPNYSRYGNPVNQKAYQDALMLVSLLTAIFSLFQSSRPLSRQNFYSGTILSAVENVLVQISLLLNDFSVLFDRSVIDVRQGIANELIAVLGQSINVQTLSAIQSELYTFLPTSSITFADFTSQAIVLCSSFLDINDPVLAGSLNTIFVGNPTGRAAFVASLQSVLALPVSVYLSDYSSYEFGKSDPSGSFLRGTIQSQLTNSITSKLNISGALLTAIQNFVTTGFDRWNGLVPSSLDLCNAIQNDVAREIVSQVISASETASISIISGHSNILPASFGQSKIDYLMNLKRYLDQYDGIIGVGGSPSAIAQIIAILNGYIKDISLASETKTYLDNFF